MIEQPAVHDPQVRRELPVLEQILDPGLNFGDYFVHLQGCCQKGTQLLIPLATRRLDQVGADKLFRFMLSFPLFVKSVVEERTAPSSMVI